MVPRPTEGFSLGTGAVKYGGLAISRTQRVLEQMRSHTIHSRSIKLNISFALIFTKDRLDHSNLALNQTTIVMLCLCLGCVYVNTMV